MAFVDFKQGLAANLPAAGSQATGVIYYVTDTKEIWFEGKRYAAGVALEEVQRALTGYLDGSTTVAGALEAAIAALDVNEFALASASNGVVTIKGIKETDGKIAVGADDSNDVTFAKVATTGAAEDISYDNTTSGLTADDVQEALDELAEASAGGVASKTVYLVDESAGQSEYAKVYKLYQGANASDMTQNTLVGTINTPKDKVVEDGSVVDITYSDGKLYDGVTDVTALIKGSGTATAADAGKYIKLVLQNVTDPLYIFAKDLVDIYTAEQNASQVQIAIDANNVISATIVAGSIDTTELAAGAVTTAKIDDDAVTTAKIADDAVTADKVAISAHSESQTAGADGLAISVTTTDGQVSAVSGSIAANTYDAYGDAAQAKSDVIGASGDASSANTIYGAKAYADGVAAAAVNALDSTAAIASVSSNVVTLKAGLVETDGIVTNNSSSDITLEEVAVTGAAADVSIEDTAGKITATTVEGALAELAGRLEWGTF